MYRWLKRIYFTISLSLKLKKAFFEWVNNHKNIGFKKSLPWDDRWTDRFDERLLKDHKFFELRRLMRKIFSSFKHFKMFIELKRFMFLWDVQKKFIINNWKCRLIFAKDFLLTFKQTFVKIFFDCLDFMDNFLKQIVKSFTIIVNQKITGHFIHIV